MSPSSAAGEAGGVDVPSPVSFRRLLVYVNSEGAGQQALQQAAAIARVTGGLVKVVTHLPFVPWPARLSVAASDAVLQARERDRLLALVAPFVREGLAVETGLVHGTPFVGVINEAIDGGFDVVMKTAAAVDSMKMGPTALHLLRKCPRPVWIVQPRSRARAPRVLASVDPDPEAGARRAAARSVLAHAAALTSLTGGELHVVHAWQPYGLDERGEPLGGAELTRRWNESQPVVRAELLELIGQSAIDLPTRRIHSIRGNPATAVPGLARTLPADIVMLSTLSDPGQPGVLIDGEAEQMLAGLDCSVVGLKTDGFVCPVAPHAQME